MRNLWYSRLLERLFPSWRYFSESKPHATRLRALAAYKDFLTLWKVADPDIPILKQAKAEHGKLVAF